MGAAILRTPEGTILHWSAGCERLFGFSASEALGRTAHELLGTRFPDGGRRTLVEEMLTHAANGRASCATAAATASTWWSPRTGSSAATPRTGSRPRCWKCTRTPPR